MTRRIEPTAPWTIRDMEIATGKCRKTVIALINRRELPGYKTSTGHYIIPAAWAEAWARGEWTPRQPEPQSVPKPDSFIRRVGDSPKAA